MVNTSKRFEVKNLEELAKRNFQLPFIFQAKVVATDDPLKLNRCRLRIIGLSDDETPDTECPWAEQMNPLFAGSNELQGISTVPAVGTWVFGFFLYGDPSKPVYIGMMKGTVDDKQDGSPLHVNEDYTDTIKTIREDNIDDIELDPLNASSKYPDNHVIDTKSATIEIDDTKGNERISIQSKKNGSYVEIRPDGTIQVVSQKDRIDVIKGNEQRHVQGNQTEQIDSALEINVVDTCTVNVGGHCTLSAPSIDLGESGLEPVILGDSFKDWFDNTFLVALNGAAVISSAPGAPSSPIQAGPQGPLAGTLPAIFSTKNKTQ